VKVDDNHTHLRLSLCRTGTVCSYLSRDIGIRDALCKIAPPKQDIRGIDNLAAENSRETSGWDLGNVDQNAGCNKSVKKFDILGAVANLLP